MPFVKECPYFVPTDSPKCHAFLERYLIQRSARLSKKSRSRQLLMSLGLDNHKIVRSRRVSVSTTSYLNGLKESWYRQLWNPKVSASLGLDNFENSRSCNMVFSEFLYSNRSIQYFDIITMFVNLIYSFLSFLKFLILVRIQFC